jgi:peptidoglycan/xylan/chitin deacetylase (PgdA/CDA1 family)
MLLVPYYHMVSDAEVRHVQYLYRFRRIREFEADIDLLLKHFAPVELWEVVEDIDGTRRFRRPSVHLTFDDGFREMHEIVAPLLQRRSVPATFFVNSAFVDQCGIAHDNAISLILHRLNQGISKSILQQLEVLLDSAVGTGDEVRSKLISIRYRDRWLVSQVAALIELDLEEYLTQVRPYLSSNEIRSLLKQGFTIGAHSHDHPLYRELGLDDQIGQTRTSMEFIEQRFGVQIKAFAFPHTDKGVSAEFFDRIFGSGVLDVSFGTNGLVPHFCDKNIERVGMEEGRAGSRGILGRHYARAAYHRLKSPRVVDRAVD